MKESEKEKIIQKCIELGFNNSDVAPNIYEYSLPFGLKNDIWVDLSEGYCDISIWSADMGDYIPIRKIESAEDLELLFNAICTEKYRLPFS